MTNFWDGHEILGEPFPAKQYGSDVFSKLMDNFKINFQKRPRLMVWWVGRVNIEVSLLAIKSIKTFSIELTSMSNLNCLFDRYYSTRNNDHF